jgi:hypothetical protein
MGRNSRPYWRNGAIAGLLGTLGLFLFAGASYGSLGGGFWIPYSAIAATLPFLPPPMPDLAFAETLVGVGVNLLLGAVWGLIYAAGIRALDRRKPYRVSRSWLEAVLLGAGLGVAVYVLSGLLAGPALVPGVRTLFPLAFFTGHLIFGEVTALAFAALSRRAIPAITFAPAEPVTSEKELTR